VDSSLKLRLRAFRTATLACLSLRNHCAYMAARNQRAIDAFFEGLDEEANDLADRLVNGDDEAVWAWFRQRYPKATSHVAKERRWRDFVTAVREYYAEEEPVE
jgi:hypothetical protein